METITLRVLPADVYDTLEFSALVFGGIGRLAWRACGPHGTVPLCALGHATVADPTDTMRRALHAADIFAAENDAAVLSINLRKNSPRSARVSFGEWCKELNVIRGD